jgi:mycoredoxin
MTFYHVVWCPECQLVQQRLDYIGIPYESVIVPDSRPQRTQVYDVSGQYYVPMIKDGEKVLTETPEILSYLETTYGQKTTPS